MDKTIRLVIKWLLFILILSACSGQNPVSPGDNGSATSKKLQVVATTTIIGDVVGNVGGDLIELSIMMKPGIDPHSFEPSPQDLTVLESADVVFINGLGLEEYLGKMVANVAGDSRIVSVSDKVDPIMMGTGNTGTAQDHQHDGADPHVWMDPNNVVLWLDVITTKLSELDPQNADTYVANSQAYHAELSALDVWIQEQVGRVTEPNRKMVTDHEAFGYYARAYGLTVVGTVIPATSTLAEPSAQELAKLEDDISRLDAPAIFVGNTVNPTLAGQVSQDTGVKVVPLYTGSLSNAEGPAPTYIKMMRYNTTAIVDALK